jgi:hypothetical protein
MMFTMLFSGCRKAKVELQLEKSPRCNFYLRYRGPFVQLDQIIRHVIDQKVDLKDHGFLLGPTQISGEHGSHLIAILLVKPQQSFELTATKGDALCLAALESVSGSVHDILISHFVYLDCNMFTSGRTKVSEKYYLVQS